MSSGEQPPDRLIVAHADVGLRMTATKLLRGAGFEVIAVGDGESARALLLSSPCPVLLLADVALGDPPFYALCKLVEQEKLPTRVLIVSSVHSGDAYKRAPSSLYGADGVVEEHLLAEVLVDKVRAALTT